MKLTRYQKRYLSQIRKLLVPMGLKKEAIKNVENRYKAENKEEVMIKKFNYEQGARKKNA